MRPASRERKELEAQVEREVLAQAEGWSMGEVAEEVARRLSEKDAEPCPFCGFTGSGHIHRRADREPEPTDAALEGSFYGSGAR